MPFKFALVCFLFASVTFVSGAPLRRSRSLLDVDDALPVEVPREESSVFDSEYGRMLLTEYSLSMSMTNAPVAFPTVAPTRVLASDIPSLIPRSVEPSGQVVSDFPSLSPSDSPSGVGATLIPTTPSHTLVPTSSPTEAVATPIPTTPSHTLVPTSSPTESETSDGPSLTPTVTSPAPSSFPTAPARSEAPSLTPTETTPSDILAPSSSPSLLPTTATRSDAPSLTPTETPSSDALAPSSFPTWFPSVPVVSDAPSVTPTGTPPSDALTPSFSPSSFPTEIPASDALAPSSFPSLFPTAPTGSDAPSLTPTETPPSDALAPSSSPSEIPASDALAPGFVPSSPPTEIPASDALAPSFVPSASPSDRLLRQRTRSLLHVKDALPAEVPQEDSSVFDSEYGCMLLTDYSLSMSVTNVPVAFPTVAPTRVLPSDIPSLIPRSVEPSGQVVSDFPSLSPSGSPIGTVVTPSPTKTIASHTLTPSSSPTAIPASDELAPSSSPTEIPASNALAPSWSPSSAPSYHSGIPNLDWLQMGDPIVPLREGLVGTDIAMSADGSIIAVGIPGQSPGYIAVYSYNETTLGWDMMGGEIFDVIGEGGIRFGSSVAISADGMTVAGGSGYSRSVPNMDGLSNPLAGRAQVNTFENGRWVQKGQSIVGTQCRSLGWSTALSGDGNRWVVGTPDVSGAGDSRCSNIDFGEVRGIVQVFDFINGGWAQVGNVISGSQPGSQLGQAVAISRDGKRVAAFSQGVAGSDPYYQVFEQDALGKWVQMGGNIPVESAVATSSTNTLALSALGSRIVVTNKRRASGLGYFKVLEWEPESNTWTQMGSDVDDADGCCFFFAYDTSVAISDYGTKVVYGNTGYRDAIALEEDNSFFRGNVRAFEYIDGSWQQVGGPMLGEDLVGEIWFGYATAMSSDGRRIAASAPVAFPNYVAAYELPYV